MSKKIAKRSLALGALMAFVITGSAMAGELQINGEKKQDLNGFTQELANGISLTGVVNIQGDNGQTGLQISDSSILKDVTGITITSVSTKTGLVIKNNSTVDVKAPITLTGTGDSRVQVYSGATFTADSIIANGGSTSTKVEVSEGATATIKNIVVKSGTFSLHTLGGGSVASNFELERIVVADNAMMQAYVPTSNGNENATTNITGTDISVELGKNATVDFGGNKSNDWDANKIGFDAKTLTVIVTDSENAGKVYISEKEGNISNEQVTVVAASDNNTGDAVADLTKIQSVVQRTTETKGSATTSKPVPSAANGVTLVQAESDIYDQAEGVTKVETNTAGEQVAVVDKETVKVTKNNKVYGIAENNALSLMTWRAETNDMNKRMGELRNAKGTHGVWVRMVRGEDEYESIKGTYNQYQLGYDEKLSVDQSWTVGAAVSYTEGDSSYTSGSAENKNTGFAIYGSKLNDDGTFIDLIAKYARLENDFETTVGNGDYSTNGYSVSAEFGKRIQQGKGLWIEPQVELTYGKVASADYQFNKFAVAQDGIESLVGRVGFSLGKDIKHGNVYARASYLYDFDGETEATFTDGKQNTRTLTDDLGGGWWEVGVGANINLSDATYIYADVEKTFGGEVDTNWQWNLGVRYSF